MDDEGDAVIGDDVQGQGVVPENRLNIFPGLFRIPGGGVDKWEGIGSGPEPSPYP